MPRLRDGGLRPGFDPAKPATIDLRLGPVDGELSVDELELAWSVQRERIMTLYAEPAYAGARPWAYWAFDLEEEMPDGDLAEAVRLAELGELRLDELAALKEQAVEAGLRVGTDAEHHGPDCWPDRAAVSLWEAVTRASRR